MFTDPQRVFAVLAEDARATLQGTEILRSAPSFGFSDEVLGLMAQDALDDFNRCLVNRDYKRFAAEVDALIQEHSLGIEVGSLKYFEFHRRWLKAQIQAAQIEIERCKGNYDNPFDRSINPDICDASLTLPKRGIVAALLGRSAEAPPSPAAPAAAPPNVVVTAVEPALDSPHAASADSTPPGQRRLSKAIELMMEEKGSSLAEKTRTSYKAKTGVLLKFLGDELVSAYGRESMLRLRKRLEKLPKHACLSENFDETPVEELLKGGGRPLAERTVLSYLSFASSVFGYCADELRWLAHSPCPAWRKSKALQRDTGWKAFSPGDLNRMFTSRYYSNPKVRIAKPHNFWIPLIGPLSGMRIDEICQLYKADIRRIGDIWCFDVNDALDKKLKGESSRRIIPVHPILIELGFLDYVDSVTTKRLWPRLKRGKNGYSHDFSKSINKHIDRHVTVDPKIVFHSFRDTFSESLTAAGVDESLIGRILGHAPPNKVTRIYTGPCPPNVMLEVMKKIDLGIDLVTLINGPTDAATTSPARAARSTLRDDAGGPVTPPRGNLQHLALSAKPAPVKHTT